MYVEYQFISKMANSENIVYGIPLYNVPISFIYWQPLPGSFEHVASARDFSAPCNSG